MKKNTSNLSMFVICGNIVFHISSKSHWWNLCIDIETNKKKRLKTSVNRFNRKLYKWYIQIFIYNEFLSSLVGMGCDSCFDIGLDCTGSPSYASSRHWEKKIIYSHKYSSNEVSENIPSHSVILSSHLQYLN